MHLEAGALEHHRHEVLADVVDVALDGADHDLADPLGAPVSASSGRRISIPAFIAFAASSTSGTKRMPSRKSIPTMRMPFDERVVQHLVGRPVPLEQDLGPLDDLVGEPVVEVVVHLRDELGVGQRAEIEVVVWHGQCCSVSRNSAV